MFYEKPFVVINYGEDLQEFIRGLIRSVNKTLQKQVWDETIPISESIKIKIISRPDNNVSIFTLETTGGIKIFEICDLLCMFKLISQLKDVLLYGLFPCESKNFDIGETFEDCVKECTDAETFSFSDLQPEFFDTVIDRIINKNPSIVRKSVKRVLHANRIDLSSLASLHIFLMNEIVSETEVCTW